MAYYPGSCGGGGCGAPGGYGYPPQGYPPPGYGAPPPVYGVPAPYPGGYAPAPVAAGGFPAGYPIYTGQLTANLYYKPIWTPKRERKLEKYWYEFVRDGVVTFNEVMHILHKFGYMVSPYEAQWFFYTLDRNRDGRVDYAELRQAMMEFVVRYPRQINPAKAYRVKPWYTSGYDWTTNQAFPGQYRTVYIEHHRHHHGITFGEAIAGGVALGVAGGVAFGVTEGVFGGHHHHHHHGHHW